MGRPDGTNFYSCSFFPGTAVPGYKQVIPTEFRKNNLKKIVHNLKSSLRTASEDEKIKILREVTKISKEMMQY